MPSHPPRSQPFKKQDILEKREEELKHALRKQFPDDKVRAAAENVRTAHLNLFKGKIAQFRRYAKDDSGQPQPGASLTKRCRRTKSICHAFCIRKSPASLPLPLS